MEKYFTFNELKEYYGWQTNVGEIKRQITFARNKGIFIQKAFKKGKTYFELIEKEYFTFKELKEKYQWQGGNHGGIKSQIIFAKNRGLIIEPKDINGTNYFKIIEDNTLNSENWKVYPRDNYFEVTENGKVRVAETKKLVSTLNSNGYYTVTNKNKVYQVHRLIKETFDPIENSENYVVDHINGIRTDNHITNLRWVTQRQNCQARDENFAKMNKNLQKMIEKYGYDGVNAIFEAILK